MTKHLRLIFGLGLSALGLYAVARSVDPAQVAAALVGVNYTMLAPTILVVLVAVWLRSVRWRQLFVERDGLHTSRLFAILMIGYLINTILPARLGDPARAILAGEMERVRPAQALATVVVERLLDILTVLLFLAAIVPFIALPGWISQSAGVMAVLAVLGFSVVLVLGRFRVRLLPFLLRLTTRLSERRRNFVATQADNLLSGTDALARPANVGVVVALCIVIWLCSVAQTYIVMLAFDLKAPVGAAVLLVVVTALGMVVPSSPGYIGVYHYLTVVTLALFGVDSSVALSYAIVLHLVTFVPLSLFGLAYLWRTSLSLGGVSARAARLGG